MKFYSTGGLLEWAKYVCKDVQIIIIIGLLLKTS